MKKEGQQCASVYYAVISAEDEVYVNTHTHTHLGIHRVLIRSSVYRVHPARCQSLNPGIDSFAAVLCMHIHINLERPSYYLSITVF